MLLVTFTFNINYAESAIVVRPRMTTAKLFFSFELKLAVPLFIEMINYRLLVIKNPHSVVVPSPAPHVYEGVVCQINNNSVHNLCFFLVLYFFSWTHQNNWPHQIRQRMWINLRTADNM